MKIRIEKVIDLDELNKLVTETYGRPYNFQQQDGYKGRGSHRFSVPSLEYCEDFDNDTVPEIVNHQEMGVSFAAWLKRDPKQKLSNKDDQESWSIDLWWVRNFYPNFQMVANDLYAKGLIEAGDYTIDIDW